MSDPDTMHTAAGTPPNPEDALEKETIGESFSRLIASGRELAEAELTWAKLKAALIAAAARRAALFGVLAFLFVSLALVTLVAAAVIALAPSVGWLGAALIVAGGLLLLALLCGLMVKRALSPLSKADRP
ncbi:MULTISPECIES: phage holin family protein [unclassified Sphingobium]|uniref:phage holin family protein n=1 Tax=unclassified Sphingobium TaxID=2611147 RepID=UPI00222507FD|nr:MULTISPECIES: phage holin family protein [unclassified Sphingobium]MCW2382039.1 putative membrane protein YqjE [Sphingobium sp. B2D3B]MCW2397781.1 putative membrane protein YqjE [Sphingobium sp. B2D3C]